jgi:hypothetical protein
MKPGGLAHRGCQKSLSPGAALVYGQSFVENHDGASRIRQYSSFGPPRSTRRENAADAETATVGLPVAKKGARAHQTVDPGVAGSNPVGLVFGKSRRRQIFRLPIPRGMERFAGPEIR